ncbi:MAG: Clp1/GlmU family protein [Methanocellales archaeon]
MYLSSDWRDLAGRIGRGDVAMVIGRVDTGKSTLIKFLASELNAAVVDADIGQSDVGPPTVVSLGRKRGEKLEMVDGYFVGSTTPAKHLLQMVVGAKKMVERAPKPCIVNTTGLVDGPIGRALKTQKIESIQPNLLILIERERELDYYRCFENVGIEVLRLQVSPYAEAKSKADRKRERERAFREHFAGAKNLKIELAKYGLERTLLGSGVLINPSEASNALGCRVLRAERIGNEVFAVVEGRVLDLEKACRSLNASYIEIADKNAFENLLVGLVDHSSNFLGLGILHNFNWEDFCCTIYTKVPSFANIQFGSLKLSLDCVEKGWLNTLHYALIDW